MSARVWIGVAMLALGAIVGEAWPAKVDAQSTSAPIQGQESELDRRTREVASQLRCPVCQGLSINDSPSELALEMKALVRDQLATGKSPKEIEQYFIEKYGEWILLEPKPVGANLLVYLLPIAAVLGGGFVIWRAVSKWSAPTASAASETE